MTSEVKWKLLSCVQLFVTPGLYSLWNSPGQNTGVGSLFFLQGIFPTQGSNPGHSLCRWILYLLRLKGITRILEWIAYPFSSGSSWSRNQTRVSCTAGGFLTNWDIRQWPRHCFILFKKKSYWSMVDSQCCVSLRYTAKWTSSSPHIYIHIYPFFFRFFSHIGHLRILSRVPVLYNRSLSVIQFLHGSAHMPSQSQFPSPPCPPVFRLVTKSFISNTMSLFLSWKKVHLYPLKKKFTYKWHHMISVPIYLTHFT